MSETWHKMGAVALGRAIEAGEIAPIKLTEHFLDALNAHPARDKIFTSITTERALAEAHAATKRAQKGTRRSILDGVPISWKDLFDVAGYPNEAGSALCAGQISEFDAQVLVRATQAGLVLLGKTHLSELAFSGLGINPITATPPNINNPNWAPGGSSSGAAASVAFGLCPAAIGSDTGGSVRIPAAWNDLVGLKTTAGLLPCDGVLPLCPKFDTVGPIGRSLEDVSAIFAILADRPAPDLGGVSLQNTRFAALDTTAISETAPEIAQAFSHALTLFAQKGATIEPLKLACVHDALALAPFLYAPEAYASWYELIEAAPEKMFPEILTRFRSGNSISAHDYVKAEQDLHKLRQSYAQAVAEFDAVLLPTCAIMPPETQHMLEDSAAYREKNLVTLTNTRIANLMGICSLSLPSATKSVGVMAFGQAFGEEKLLRIGRALEAALARS